MTSDNNRGALFCAKIELETLEEGREVDAAKTLGAKSFKQKPTGRAEFFPPQARERVLHQRKRVMTLRSVVGTGKNRGRSRFKIPGISIGVVRFESSGAWKPISK